MYDTIVIGGGPAGSTAATLLARQGFSVLLLERERFPRFQIGESLLPYNNDLFDRLGVTDKLVSGDFHPKFGAYFVTGDGSVGYSFRFDRTLPEPYTRSFQVKRSEFDAMLLRHAAASGVTVREETPVAAVDLSDPNRAVVRTLIGEELEARFVIDASGHTSIVGSRVGDRADIASLKKIAVFAHYRNVPRAPGRDAGNTVIVVLRDAWFWMIPITADLMSVGLVVDREHITRCGLDPDELLEATIAETPYVADLMQRAERASQVYVRKDFSYRMRNLAGPNFALIGDAAGFLDPIFSTGVFMAMSSADLAASAIAKRLQSGSMRALERYERELTCAMGKYFRFIDQFYRREFLEVLMQPTDKWGLLQTIIGIFGGDIFVRRDNRLKIALFFALVKIQKWRGGIAPRIAWDSLPAASRMEAT
ncbi:MAG TPA: NAD(P)/FAD-dependent oxidoreductase [Thermoanaerobaculia bacterium]|nr:NAD(P)/FAD-dependent oxidoreductase [Thermoanaerobaculia bacterium]